MVQRLIDLVWEGVIVAAFCAMVSADVHPAIALVVAVAVGLLGVPLNYKRANTASDKPTSRRGQRASDFPPPYPNGWFAVHPSDSLKPGEVAGVTALAQQLAVFRDHEGRASVLDAFCPHLGANLAEGGTVTREGCLRCPFHGWEFDGEGKCKRIVGTDCIPNNSNARAYPTTEANGMIFAWFHAANAPPQWEIDRFPYVDSGFFYVGGTAKSSVRTHIREIPENGADSAHLNVLHKDFVVPPLRKFGLEHTWTATWRPHDTETHKSQIRLTQAFVLLGFPLPGTHIETEIQQIGPGIVSLLLKTAIGRIHVFEYVTPVAPLEQRVAHMIFVSPWIPRVIANFVLLSLDAQFHRDQPIWEAKRMATRPVISKADGPILEFRRWWQRFYSPESMSFADAVAKESMLDW